MAGLDLDMELLDILSRVRLETLASRMGSGDERAGQYLSCHIMSCHVCHADTLSLDLLSTYALNVLIISLTTNPNYSMICLLLLL